MHYGKAFKKYLDAVLAAYDQHEATVANLIAAEQKELGEEGFLSKEEHRKEREEYKKYAFNKLLSIATKHFAPTGGKLEIDKQDVLHAMATSEREYPSVENVDLVAMWDWLEQTYGGEKGAEIGHQQNAGVVVRGFGIRAGTEPKLVGGRLTLDVLVWLDDLDKKYGRNRLSYNCSGSVQEICRALSTFAAWAGDTVTESHIHHAARWFDTHTDLVSRKKYPVGEIEIVTYFNRFEFRFQPKLAESLMEYLSLYGNLTKEAA